VGRVTLHNPGGYGIMIDVEGGTEEHDTFTCPHCNSVQIVRPGSGTKRGYCRLCDSPTCGKEKCLECVPFIKKIERYERREELRRIMERA